MSQEVVRWGDIQQYKSERMPHNHIDVHLLNATHDPLGTVAATCGIYEGKVYRSLDDIGYQQRVDAFHAMMNTELRGPLETVQFNFLVEGVDRAFTHQMVRERQAFFAQESLRFAVKESFWDEVELPPSLKGLPEDHPRVAVYRSQLKSIGQAYQALVDDGMPAEEARKLLPHAVTTRLHWCTSLRSLIHVAGLRTCTQAQFDWRIVMARVAMALRAYARGQKDEWQFRFIADQIRPVCYHQGKCGFMANFDRDCSIRERVELNHQYGRPSNEWHEPMTDSDNSVPDGGVTVVPAIQDWEWAADPAAARRQ